MSTDLIEYDSTKIDLIKRTVAKGATDDELALFLHACKRTGLDPFMKQIHAIKRWSAADNRETMAIQTGIDGYRLMAERTGKYAGSDEPVFEERGDDHPSKATVTVWKLVEGSRCSFTASARWEEYVQKKKDGQPTSFWLRMPYGQLAKCAEALALRKAFPAELSGVYTHEEMQQADNPIQININKPVLDILQVRLRNDATMVQAATDKYTGEPIRQEDDAGEQQVTAGSLDVQAATSKSSDAPAPKPQSAAEFIGKIADTMQDQYEEGVISNLQPYQGTKAYQKGCKPGYFDLEDGQGGLVKKFKFMDPALDISSGLKRVYYRTENYQGKTSYAVTKIEAAE